MKKYNHIGTINLGKLNIQYISKVDGTVVFINSLCWRKDSVTGHKYCYIKRPYAESTYYTAEQFHDEFHEFIPRDEELKRETANAFAQRIKNAMDSVAINNQVQNSKIGRVYTGNEFANYIADKIGNVSSALDNIENPYNKKSSNIYSDKEYAIAIAKNKSKGLFTYDLVADPGFNGANVSKPVKLKKGPYYG